MTKMDKDPLPGNDPRTQHPVRNVSTAPAHMFSDLESLIEEDETAVQVSEANESHSVKSGPQDTQLNDKVLHQKEIDTDSKSVKDSKPNVDLTTARTPELSRKNSKPSSSVSSRGHVDAKTVSRASSSKKSRASGLDTGPYGSGDEIQTGPHGLAVDHGHLGYDSDNDDLQRQLNNQSELDMADGEDDPDTDLEPEEATSTYDHTGRTLYLDACKQDGVVPSSYFLRHMNDLQLSMKHHGLAGEGMRPIAICLVSNATITSLDLTDNWLGYEGGLAICEMLKENCFIADLNLSDNNLKMCAAQLCDIIQKNDTLRKVNLSGNGFDDTSAEHLANMILATAKLESLNLSHNHLGEKSGLLLGPAISENLCLKELDLSWNHLRRKGAIAVAAGVKSNVFMKKVNLSWNGFGQEASSSLMDALKTNNVLEEIDLTNNRITTEGAVLVGKGLTVNETLKSIKIGKNPMQSAGCWAIAAAILKNPNCVLEVVDFADVIVNKDFVALWKQVEEKFPTIKIVHGGTEIPLKPKQRIHPLVKIRSFINAKNIRLIDFFNKFDKDGSMNVTRDELKQGILDTGINLSLEEVDLLVNELDVNEDGAINYSELAVGQVDIEDRRKKISTYTGLRPMTS